MRRYIGRGYLLLRWLPLGVLALAVLLLLTTPALRMWFKFAIDYNEGWNAYHAARAAAGQPIYDASNVWTPADYPPLSFYIVGLAGRMVGDPVIAGRVISFLALLAIGLLAGRIVQCLGGDLHARVLAVLLCIGPFAAYGTHYVGMNDPQMLGSLFMMVGLWLYVSRLPAGASLPWLRHAVQGAQPPCGTADEEQVGWIRGFGRFGGRRQKPADPERRLRTASRPNRWAAIFRSGLARTVLGTENRWLFLVALCCALGLLVKYNLLPLPAAIGLDLLLRSRKALLKWLGFVALILGGFFAIAYLVWGVEFFRQMLLSSTTFSLGKAIEWSSAMARRIALPLLLTAPWAVVALLNARWRVIALYLGLAALFGVYTSSSTGTDVNVFFDLFMALGMAGGLLATWTAGRGAMADEKRVGWIRGFSRFGGQRQKPADPERRLRTASRPERAAIFKPVVYLLPLVLGFGLLLAAPQKAARPWTLDDFKAREAAFLADAAFLAGQPGPAICETILLCYYAGKPFLYDPYNAGEMQVKGIRPEGDLLRQLEAQEYAVVQLNRPLPDRYREAAAYTPAPQRGSSIGDRFTENTKRALGAHYRLARQTGQRSFYLPR